MRHRPDSKHIRKGIASFVAALLVVSGTAAAMQFHRGDDVKAEELAVQSDSNLSAAYQSHLVPTVDIPTAKINMFDYLLNDDDTEPGFSSAAYTGINMGHALVFAPGAGSGSGLWNEWTGNNSSASPRLDIMKPILGDDGYPVLNLDDSIWDKPWEEFDKNYPGSNRTESMAYLFDPDFSDAQTQSYRRDYTNLNGLFQLDADGQYSFESRQNYAWLDQDNKRFCVFDTPAVYGMGLTGFFFPMEPIGRVFAGEYDGKLIAGASRADSGVEQYVSHESASSRTNHFSSFTMEMPFYMPQGGEVINDDGKSTPMTFSFSGDDDVWIFIDDVLVGDLGGNHNEVRMNMDFKTGKIDVATATSGTTTTSWNPNFSTTIRSQFEKAHPSDKGASTIGGVDFSGETFAPETSHTLKMFYLERGNTANMSMSFNLQFPQFQQVAKVDDNGDALPGVQFDLYPLSLKPGHSISGFEASIDDFETVDTTSASGRVATTVTGDDGMGNIHDLSDENKPYDFDSQAESGQLYYMLVERTPDGYMSAKNPTLLVYDAYDEKSNPDGTNMLLVMSRFNAGTYSSFTSFTNVKSSASYVDPSTAGTSSEKSGSVVPSSDKSQGLALAVPSVESSENGEWMPLYGGNTMGWDSVDESSYPGFRDRALAAALYQAVSFPRRGWVLGYTQANGKMSGELSGFPDRARSYISQSDDGFLRLDYLVLGESALRSLGVTGSTPQERYDNLVDVVNQRVKSLGSTDAAVSHIVGKISSSANLLYRQDVSQTFKSMIYVGNAQNRLYLQKTDAAYEPIDGKATFAIYADAECTEELGTISTDPGNDSLIEFIFDVPAGEEARVEGSTLHLPVTFGTYYLKETVPPQGFEINGNVIEVENTATGAHVSAGNDHDDIDVGITQLRLTSPMVQFAYDDGYYSTLTGTVATLGSSAIEDDDVEKHLVFNKDTRRYVVAEPGGNQEVSIGSPLFLTDVGMIDISFKQDMRIHDGSDATNATSTRYEDLGGADITDLFYPVRTVYVKDTYAYGDMLVGNTVVNAPDRDRNPDRKFSYHLHMNDKSDKPLEGSYTGYILSKDEADAISSSPAVPDEHDLLKVASETRSVTFAGGAADISLADGQYLYIKDLPRNAYFDLASADAEFPDAKGITRENAPGYDYSVSGTARPDGSPARISSSVLHDSLVEVNLHNEYRCAYFQIEKFVHGKGANPIYPFSYELHFYADESMSPDSEITHESNPEFFAYASGGDRTGKHDSYDDTAVAPNSLGTYMVSTIAGRTSDTDDETIMEHGDAVLTIEVPTAGKDMWVKVVEGIDTNYFVVDKGHMDSYFSDPANIAAGVKPEDDVPESDEVQAKQDEWSTRKFKLTETAQGDLSKAPMSTYYNQVRRGTLSIKKTVEANPEDAALLQNKSFDFAISLFQDPEMTIPLKLDGYDYRIIKDSTELRRGTFKNKDVVQVKMDEIISIIGLPAGSFYISNETKTPGFMPDTPEQNSYGNIDPDGEITVPFVNKYSPRTIMVSKKVDLAPGQTVRPDPEAEYEFVLTLYTDEEGTQVYNPGNEADNRIFYYTKNGGNQDTQWLSGNGDPATSTFKIKEDGYIAFDTPASVKSWKVVEKPNKYFDGNTAKLLYDYDDAADDGNGAYRSEMDATAVAGHRDSDLESKIVPAPTSTPCEMVVANVYQPEPVLLPFSGNPGFTWLVLAAAGLMCLMFGLAMRRDAKEHAALLEMLSQQSR